MGEDGVLSVEPCTAGLFLSTICLVYVVLEKWKETLPTTDSKGSGCMFPMIR